MLTAATSAFTLEHATVRRDGVALLSAVTCEIPAGSCTALVGPSGAGKSTLLRLLNRLEESSSGMVRFESRPLPDWNILTLRRRGALVGQQPVLLTDRVLDDPRVGRPDLGEHRARDLLRQVGLPTDMLERPTAGLSGGEAQRVCLARALAVGPGVLLLDEPTSALDPVSATAVETAALKLVASGLAVVLVSHNTAQARRMADHVLVLDGGRLIEHGPAREVGYLKEGA